MTTVLPPIPPSQKRLMKKQRHDIPTWGWMFTVLVLIAAGGVGVFFWLRSPSANTAIALTTGYQTSTVRKEDLSISATGSGRLVPEQTLILGFSTSGTLAEVNGQAGDRVKKGDRLAALDGINSLELDVSNKQLAFQKAQQALEDLLNSAKANLAQALADQAAAQAAYDDALANLHQKGDPRCEKEQTLGYYAQYLDAENQLAPWEDQLTNPETPYGYAYLIEKVTPLRQVRDRAYISWKYCEGYTDEEIQASEAALALASAKRDHAELQYQARIKNNGIDPTELAIAQASVEKVQMDLANAQALLDSAVLLAPFDGTITYVNASAGDPASANLFSLSDLHNSVIQATVDESDLLSFTIGCPATVTFTSLPGQEYEGVITRVNPTLTTSFQVSMVSGEIELDDAAKSTLADLPTGLQAVVEVSCSQAKDALVVPTQAVYQDETNTYVYVLNALGKPEKRAVEIGLSTTALTQIRSGVSEGERVILSTVTQP